MGKIIEAEKLLLGKGSRQMTFDFDPKLKLPRITIDGVEGVMHDDIVFCKYKRCTLAEVKAGVTVLSGVPGYKIRVVQCGFTAIGGAGGGADGVKLLGTVAGSSANLATVLAAALVENVYHEIGFTNETPTLWIAPAAAGLTFAGCDVGTAITCEDYGGAALDTLTHLDVVLRYCLDQA
jgi:hypothetical protein